LTTVGPIHDNRSQILKEVKTGTNKKLLNYQILYNNKPTITKINGYKL